MNKLSILVLSFGLFLSQAALAGKPICNMRMINAAKTIAQKHSAHDKNRHCLVSCTLSLYCNVDSVAVIGLAKEVSDMFGPGNAEMRDMKANSKGMNFVRSGKAKSINDCKNSCDRIYYP